VFPDAETKKKLNELHLRKIDLCDWVWVVRVRVASLDAQLCAVKESARLFDTTVDGYMLDEYAPNKALRIIGSGDAWRNLLAALSSSSPCRHAAEADAMREALEKCVGALSHALDPSVEILEQDADILLRAKEGADAALKGGGR
jgi:hypothetical protein